MRYPSFLHVGDTIGLVAPSFGCTTEPYASCFEKSKAFFANLGYRLEEGPNCRCDIGIGKSNTPQACGEELNDFFLRRNCQMVWSVGGGETMCEDLPFVDFDALAKAPPKWFMGFSDNTNLTFLLPTLCDTASVYGPNFPSFGVDMSQGMHQSLKDALAILQGNKTSVTSYDGWEKESLRDAEHPFAPYHITMPSAITLTKGGIKQDSLSFSGRLLGGCLDCLINLCGTKFDKVKTFAERYHKDGIVWFLEACDLSLMSQRRALWQLREAGWFDTARGFIFGRPYHFDDDSFGMTHESCVNDILRDLHLPIIHDADIGHLPPMMPLITGAMAHVTATDTTCSIDMFLQ